MRSLSLTTGVDPPKASFFAADSDSGFNDDAYDDYDEDNEEYYDGDDKDFISSPEELSSALEGLFSQAKTSTAFGDGKDPKLIRSTQSTEELEELLAKMKAIVGDDAEAYDDSGGDGDAPFLTPDIYENYNDFIDEDGSMLPPDIIGLTKRGKKEKGNSDEPTLETLYTRPTQDPRAVSEELHQQVMAEEEGFENQSELFKDFLGSRDASAFQKKQETDQERQEIIEKLDREIEEFEESIKRTPIGTNKKTCCRCGCVLTREDIMESTGDQVVCYICQGEELVANSDMKFLEGDDYDSNGDQDVQNVRTPNQRRNMREYMQKSSRSFSDPSDVAVLKKENTRLRGENIQLQRELSTTEGRVRLLRQRVTELERELSLARKWEDVDDPNAGDLFYNSEETYSPDES